MHGADAAGPQAPDGAIDSFEARAGIQLV